ncbi:MAG: M48 family metalloprotease, partial [Xanthomonadales bacterium]|nr:M48 family metalloprotease [Xanthomonadales bacterium]
MSLQLGLVAACTIVFAAAAVCAAFFSKALFPFAIGRMSRLEPAARANFLFAWAAFPLLSGLLLVCFTLAPSVAHGLGFGIDHCHVHGHHAHLCFFHTALFTGSAPERLLLGAIGLSVLAWAAVIGTRLRRQRQVLRMLVALGSESKVEPCHNVVRSDRPVAITVGWINPTILISSRLLDDLSPAEAATVLAHEQAHQRRRDGLRLFATEIVSRLHWPATRRH